MLELNHLEIVITFFIFVKTFCDANHFKKDRKFVWCNTQ